MEEKMKKRMLALVGIVALLGLVLPVVAFSAEDTVTCTVSAFLVSLSVDDGSVDYGVIELGQWSNTALYDEPDNPMGMDPPQTQNITNTGTVHEEFRIKTSNAVGATNWTLGLLQDSDTFTHAYSLSTVPYTGDGTLFTFQFTAADSYFLDADGIDVPPGAVRYLELEIGMPTSVTDYGSHNITVTIEASQA
jgi:hypothetical protein